MVFLLYNQIGILMLIFSCIIGLLINKDNPAVAGVLALIVDLGYRFFSRKEEDRAILTLIGPLQGGQFFFLPIWAWGLFGLIVGLTGGLGL